MIVTEKEAKNKRCCGPDGCGDKPAIGPRLCIGSACMAWRHHFETVRVDNGDRTTNEAWLKARGTDAEFEVEERYLGRGFCGLAYRG